MTRHALVATILLAASACGEEDAPAERQQATTQPSRPAETQAAPQPAEPPPVVTQDGLTLHRRDDGTLELRGSDRWGGRVDTTYESAEFLENALPVLERSITPEQAAALRRYVDQQD